MKTKTYNFQFNLGVMKLFVILSFILVAIQQQAGAQVPRKVIAEDFTGMWCGYCPLGRTVAEHLEATYPNTVINIGMHDEDALQSNYSHEIDSINTYGFPGFLVDRSINSGYFWLGVGASCVGSDIDYFINQRLAITSPVSVGISSSYNSSTRALQVTVNANFAAAATGQMNISCILTEDSISTPGQQDNYMNTDNNYPCWEGQGDPITTYYQRHTARINLASSEWGDGGVIPANVAANSSYQKLYNYSVPSTWNATHLHIVAFVSHYGTTGGFVDTTKIDILNANTVRMGHMTAINEISNSQIPEINIFPNPATNNITIETPQNSTIEITNIQGQLIKTLAANNEKTIIDVSALPSGVYVVEVKTDRGVAVKKFIIAPR
jgi:hypothetical protein